MQCFIEKKFLTKEEVKIIKLNISHKPISEIIKDFRSKTSIYSFIVKKRNKDYNQKYFKSTPHFSIAHRKPFWLSETIDVEIIEAIRNEQINLIDCLYESNLISELTYKKIKEKIKFGLFYKIWEILTAASDLTKNEEFYSSLNIVDEVKKFIDVGLIKEKDSKNLIEDLTSGKINQFIDIIEKYNIGYTVYVKNASPDPVIEIKYVLDYFLPKLPFYKNHKVNEIKYYENLLWPINKSCVLNLTFNNLDILFPIKMSGHIIKFSHQFNFYLIPKIIHYLYKINEKINTPLILNNTFLDYFDYQQNFESFTLLIPKETSLMEINKGWIRRLIDNDFPHFPIEKKVGYLKKLFGNLDNHRYSKETKEKIFQNIINSDIREINQIPLLIDNFLTIIWEEEFGPSCSYKTILEKFKIISNNQFDKVELNETELGEFKLVSIKVEQKIYSQKLQSKYMDYNFCQLIYKIQNEIDFGGKFYVFSSSDIDDGYSFVYLSHNEHDKLKTQNIIKFYTLDKVINLWELR